VAAPDVNALGYVALARALGAAEAATVVQARAAGERHPRREYEPEEQRAMAAACLAAVRAAEPRGPYFLAGMCDGAHVAFEMARLLEAEGERVALLAVLDTWPVENTAHYALVRLEQLRGRWSRASGREQLDLLKNRARALVRPARAREGERRRAEDDHRRWRARVWPGPGFVPTVYGGRITVLRAARQPFWRIRDEALGWRARSAEPVDVHVIPGEHVTLLREPNVTALAGTLTACLHAARAAARAPRPAAARGSHP
jgi:thioesterase domain-containing protein